MSISFFDLTLAKVAALRDVEEDLVDEVDLEGLDLDVDGLEELDLVVDLFILYKYEVNNL